MHPDKILYKDGMPFYPVTFPVNEADGLVIEDLQLHKLIEYINDKKIKSGYIYSMDNFSFLEQCTPLEHITIELRINPKYYSKLEKNRKGFLKKTYDSTPIYQLRKLKVFR